MNNSSFSIFFSFLALTMYSTSYFFKRKSTFLVFQGFGGLFLVFSYFFIARFFAMISLFIGLARTFSFYYYEKNDKRVPVWLVILICVAIFTNYFTVNLLIYRRFNILDIFLVVSFCMYAIVFSIRNLMLVRYLVIVPHVLTILYNLLTAAPIFTAISYFIELVISIVSICYFKILDKKAKEVTIV